MRARKASTNADVIASFIEKLDREIAALKIEVRARKNVRKFLRGLLRSDEPIESTAALKEVHSQGVAEPRTDAGERLAPMVTIGADTSPISTEPPRLRPEEAEGHGASRISDREPPAGTQAPPVDINSDELQTVLARDGDTGRHPDAGEVGPGTVGASPAPLRWSGKPGGPSGSSAPPLHERVATILGEHPQWSVAAVSKAVQADPLEVKRIMEAIEARPVAAVAADRSMPLREQVRIMHERHPAGTARMIAADLGASGGSVSTYLAEARKSKPAEPLAEEPFIGEVALRQRYADGRKRLGAVA